MGGPAILKKKWGDLCFLGGPNDLLANSGGTYLYILQKLFMCMVTSPHHHQPSMIMIVVSFQGTQYKNFACGANYEL